MTDNELDYRTVSQCISSDYCRGWNEAVAEAIDLINRQKAEIEHLKVTTIIGEVREIPMQHKTLALVSWEHTLVKAVKAEVIKEFAERLKEKFCDIKYQANTDRKTVRVSELRDQMDWLLHTVSIEVINDAAKEMTGGSE